MIKSKVSTRSTLWAFNNNKYVKRNRTRKQQNDRVLMLNTTNAEIVCMNGGDSDMFIVRDVICSLIKSGAIVWVLSVLGITF